MSAERLKTQLTQIEQLSETLNALLQSVTAAANPAIRKNIEGLESEKRKLIYQANILQRAIEVERKEASENDILSDWDSASTGTFNKIQHPVLPKKGQRNVLITSALPYCNNVPHLGNIIGCVLSADVFARYCRIRGHNTIYICGTDEYGTATETKAIQDDPELYKKDVRAACQAVCDKYFSLHKEVYDWFNISTDYFGRTSTKQQTEIVHEIFTDIEKNGYWIEKEVEQLFSPGLDKFLADRFVEGTCPKPGCGYEDARGDQCDKCGCLLAAIDLINPRCKFTGCKPEVRTSKHLFLDLPQLEPEIKNFLARETSDWSNNSRQIVESWLKKGLMPRQMTRDLKWGIPVPREGYENKVFYVWFDAPIGYPSITACYTEKWRDWWFNKDVEYFQFMGKDNVPFHSVFFPAYLIATKKNWKLVNNIQGTEYLNYENGKFSKSRGVGVFGSQAKETDIPSDVWRFYLIYVRPEVQDTEFQWSDFQAKNNSELLNNLGNFINRGLTFVQKFYDSKVPVAQIDGTMRTWCKEVNDLLKEYFECMEKNNQREGLRTILSISKLGNKLIQVWQPWVKVKSKVEKERHEAAAAVMLSANLCLLISALLEPFMPETSIEIARQLGHDRVQIPSEFKCYLKSGHQISGATPLFKKITDEEVADYRSRFAGKQE